MLRKPFQFLECFFRFVLISPIVWYIDIEDVWEQKMTLKRKFMGKFYPCISLNVAVNFLLLFLFKQKAKITKTTYPMICHKMP